MNRRQFLATTLTLASTGLIFTGCGGGSGGDGTWSRTTRPGRVELPPGLSLAQSQVISLLGKGVLNADGTFQLTVAAGATQFSQVRDSAGNLLLFGFLREGQTALSVRSTAEALLYFSLGLFAHAPKLRAQALERLRTEDLTAVESAISAAVAAHGASWLSVPLSGVGAAVKEKVRALHGTTRGRGMIVTPTERVSGLQIEGDGIGACTVTNGFRRRSLLFHTPVSAKREEGSEFELPQSLIKTEMPPTDGISSPLGALADLFAEGKSYYQPVSVALQTPRTPDTAVYTKYKVYAVGPGPQKGTWDELPQQVKDEGLLLIIRSALLDFFFPFLASVIVPGFADEIDDFVHFTETADVLKDVINAIAKVPELLSKIDDFAGFCAAVGNFIMGTDGLQIILLSVMITFLELKFGKFIVNKKTGMALFIDEYIPNVWSKIDKVLDFGELALTAFDTGMQVLDIASSRRGETWDVAVTKVKVSLAPQEVLVMKNSLFSGIKANLVGVEVVEGKVFGYSWKCRHGKLSDGSQIATMIESSSHDSVAYDAAGVAGGTVDEIEVTAFLKGGGSQEPLGSAKLKVYIAELSVSPRSKTLKANEMVTLTAAVTGMRPLKPGEALTYKWLTTRTAGELLGSSDGGTAIPVEGTSATYRAHATKQGQDSVTVAAYLGTTKLGSELAKVTVGSNTITVAGRFHVETIPSTSNPGFTGVTAVLYVPKIEGAKSYSVYAHDFNDTAYYGTSYRASWTMPYLPSGYGDRDTEFVFGLSGGQSRDKDVAGAVDYLNGRFAGMIVDVTVTL